MKPSWVKRFNEPATRAEDRSPGRKHGDPVETIRAPEGLQTAARMTAIRESSAARFAG